MNNPEPKSFVAGEAVSWRCYEASYLANNGWVLTYNFRSTLADSAVDLVSIADNEHHVVTLLSETTKDYKSGSYSWQCAAKKDEELHIVRQGMLEIKPNLSALTTFDGRSHVKKMLDALEATLLGKASLDQLSYSISGRSLLRLSPSELLKWRDVYRAEYNRELQQEKIAQNLGVGNLIKVRF
jgi:hypothetical protein